MYFLNCLTLFRVCSANSREGSTMRAFGALGRNFVCATCALPKQNEDWGTSQDISVFKTTSANVPPSKSQKQLSGNIDGSRTKQRFLKWTTASLKLAAVILIDQAILIEHTLCDKQASLVAQTVKHLPAIWETWVRSLGREDPLEKEMATHSSTLAWKIPWTEEPGMLQSMGSQRVGHDWATSLTSLP